MQLARYFNLLITGGSDDHGWPAGLPRLSRQPVTLEQLEAVKNRASEYRVNRLQ
jgi:hypothetical protein